MNKFFKDFILKISEDSAWIHRLGLSIIILAGLFFIEKLVFNLSEFHHFAVHFAIFALNLIIIIGLAKKILVAQSSLKKVQTFQDRFINSSYDCIKYLDLDARLLFINESGIREMEIEDVEKIINTDWRKYWENENGNLAAEAFAKAKGGSVGRFEGCCPSRRGKPKWWDVVVTPLLDEHGNPQEILVISRNITEIRQVQESLQHEFNHFQSIAESLPQLVWKANPDGHVEYANQKWYAYTGLSPESTYGFNWIQAVHPDDHSRVADIWKKILTKGENAEFEYRIKRFDGAYRWHLARGQAVYGEDKNLRHWIGTTTDIHDQKESKRRVRQAEERLSSVVNQASMIIWGVDRDGNYTLAQGKSLTSLGLSSEALKGKNHLELFGDIPGAKENLKRALTGESFVAEIEVKGISFETHFTPVREGKGPVTGVAAVSVETTSRKQAEKERDKFFELLNIATSAGGVGVFEMNINSKKVWRNEAHDLVFGYKKMLPEWTLDIFLTHIYIEDRERVHKKLISAIELNTGFEMEFRVIWPDRSVHWMAVTGKVHWASRANSPLVLSEPISISRIENVPKQKSTKAIKGSTI